MRPNQPKRSPYSSKLLALGWFTYILLSTSSSRDFTLPYQISNNNPRKDNFHNFF